MANNESELASSVLVGRFFHVLADDGKADMQGEILGEPEKGVYLVRYFEWMHGEPSSQHLVPFAEMREATWRFYDSSEEMNFAWEHRGLARKWIRYSLTGPRSVTIGPGWIGPVS